jgi:hypothetical protein
MSVLYNTEKARDAALATPMAEGCALAFDRLEALLLADAC